MTSKFDAKPTTRAPLGERVHYLDNLRVALVVLVVLHHVAIVYGGFMPFYYVEPPFGQPRAGASLLVFALANQAWFMGAMFFLAGYFTPGSFERKGPAAFLKARLIRLGIPVVVFVFVLSPVSSIGFFLMPASLTGITEPPTWSTYFALLGLGPLWFAAMLLIFDFGYAAWRILFDRFLSSLTSRLSPPGFAGTGAFVLALALVSYLTRMVVPLGREMTLFVEFLDFPTIAYLPQYVSFFVLGAIAYRHDWFGNLSWAMGITGFVVAIAGTALFLPLAMSGQFFVVEFTEPARGYGHWQSAVYALWDTMTAVGLCLGLAVLFRQFLDTTGWLGRFLAQHSYAVYVFHIPIIVFVAFAMRNIQLATLFKFAATSVVVIPVCFVVAYLVRKIPLASRIL